MKYITVWIAYTLIAIQYVRSSEIPAPLINKVADCRENAEMQLMYAAVVAYHDLLSPVREGKGLIRLFCKKFATFWAAYEDAAKNKKEIRLASIIEYIERATREESPEEETCLDSGVIITRAIKKCTGNPNSAKNC